MKDKKWKCAFCDNIISRPTFEKCKCINTIKESPEIKDDFKEFKKKENNKIKKHKKLKLKEKEGEDIHAKKEKIRKGKEKENKGADVFAATEKIRKEKEKKEKGADVFAKKHAAQEKIRKEKEKEGKGAAVFATQEKIRKEKEKKEKGAAVVAKKRAKQTQNRKANQSDVKTDLAFKESTKDGPDFTCICCHRQLFKKSMCKLTEQLEKTIRNQNEGILHKCVLGIRSPEETETDKNKTETKTMKAAKKVEMNKYRAQLKKAVLPQIPKDMKMDGEAWLCSTCCSNHLKKGKMPPQCHQNGLVLKKSLQDNPETALTDTENVLIARHIAFAKLQLTPTSRWRKLDGKIINIPITKDKMEQTVKCFPRTPAEGQMISIAVKRSKAYDNTYIAPFLARPGLIITWLNKLKDEKNPHYQDVHIQNEEQYEQRCYQEDPEGFSQLHPETLKAIQGSDDMDEDGEEGGESNEDEEEDEEVVYKRNDPVKRNQVAEEKRFYMADMYPEEKRERKGNNVVVVSPGEGGRVTSILTDKNWDVKTFPCLYNLDGSNGMGEKREVHLWDQKFFEQRIFNKDQRYAYHPEYIFTAATYIEQKQINSNLFTQHTTGKKVKMEGKISFQKNDAFAVLDKIKGTPKYWQSKKFELIAKLETWGPFHWFFTLSCADKRWPEVFVSYLRGKGMEVEVEVREANTEGQYAKIEAYVIQDEERIELKTFIKEHLQENDHEIIQRSVLKVTRIFNHRLQNFIKIKMKGGSNPMHIEHYQYRIEFQARGAAHAHGVLWTDIKKLDEKYPGIKSAYDAMHVGDRLWDLAKNDEENVEKPAENHEKQKHKENGNKETLVERNRKRMRQVKALTEMVDAYVTCSLNTGTVGEEAASIAEETQWHKHSMSCRKYIHVPCRFNFPRYPAPYTIVTQKFREEEVMQKSAKITEKIRRVLEDKEHLKTINEKIPIDMTIEREEYMRIREERIRMMCQMADVKYEEYLKALGVNRRGYGIVLQRDINEIWINNYNKEWLVTWNGNLDIAPCIDSYGVATYITEYAFKEEAIASELKKILEDNKGEDMKTKQKMIANGFQKKRQIGEAEAAFKLVGSMEMCHGDVKAGQYVPTGTDDETYKRSKQATKEDKEAGREVMQIDGIEGEWCTQWNIRDKYLRREPRLHHISLGQYTRMFNTGPMHTKKKDEDEDEDDMVERTEKTDIQKYAHPELFEVLCCQNECCEETDEEKYKKKTTLPEVSDLTYVYPGEPATMKRRTSPAVIRSHKPKKANDHVRFFMHELQLYIPWGCEGQPNLLKATDEDVTMLYAQWEKHIEEVKKILLPYQDDIEEARQLKIEADALEMQGAELAPEKEQDNNDAELADDEPGGEFENLVHPGEHEDGEDVPRAEKTMISKITMVPTEEMRRKVRGMDRDQQMVLKIAIKYFKDIKRARANGTRYPNPPHLLVHGAAGVGKSHVIDTVCQWGEKILRQPGDMEDDPYIVKCAWMGTAAANIGGGTLTSTFNLAFGNQHKSLPDNKRDMVKTQFQNLALLVIDEISTVGADQLYMIDAKLKEIKGTGPENLFGGVCVLCFGDLFQLPPVKARKVFKRPTNPAFHMQYIVDPIWQTFTVVNLKTNHRQGENMPWADLLNRLRTVRPGEISEADLRTLRSRVRPRNHPDIKNADMHIVTLRKQAKAMNDEHLNKLQGEEVRIEATNWCKHIKNFKPRLKADGTINETAFCQTLELKVGSQAMMIRNLNTSDKLTNGQMGTITAFDKAKDGTINFIMVTFKNNEVGRNKREEYPELKIKYPGATRVDKVTCSYDLGNSRNGTGAKANFRQFPLILANAVTSHKCQGQTIEQPTTVCLDLSERVNPAQAYVMLGRAQSMEQVFIVGNLHENKIHASEEDMAEVNMMEQRSLDRNPTIWQQKKENQIKIATLNINNLHAHIEDLKSDHDMKEANIILLSETWLKPEDETKQNLKIKTYKENFVSAGNGKGLAGYSREDVQHEKSVKGQDYQVMKLIQGGDLHIISAYRSSGSSVEAFTEDIINLITDSATTVITGDMNICARADKKSYLITRLAEKGFHQLVKEPTHEHGRTLDHIYIKINNTFQPPEVVRMPIHYSDHDIMGLVLTRGGAIPMDTTL
jgi:hypothetical protein